MMPSFAGSNASSISSSTWGLDRAERTGGVAAANRRAEGTEGAGAAAQARDARRRGC